jgi:hypothetical protein
MKILQGHSLMRYLILTIFAIAMQAQAALAWGPNGHRITAQIGARNMTPATALWVFSINDGRSLALMATWPDFVRSFPEYDCFKPWHFLTVEDRQSLEDAMKLRPEKSGACDMEVFHALDMPANVVEAIDYFSDILRGDAVKAANFAKMLQANGATPYNGSIDQTALALVVHLVGDVHQPLHVGRGPDRGGNAIAVKWFDEPAKLHEVWDELMIDSEKLSYSEFAAFLKQRFGKTDIGDYQDGAVSWALESVGHRAAVYDFGAAAGEDVPNLSYEYQAKHDAFLKQRLFQGGKRLSVLLNDIFNK